jgi:hypothetical protein
VRFVELVHAFGRDWELKAAWNFEQSEDDAQLFYAYGTPIVRPVLACSHTPPTNAGGFTARQLDVRAAGPLRIGGRRSTMSWCGASWTKGRTEELSWYPNGIGTRCRRSSNGKGCLSEARIRCVLGRVGLRTIAATASTATVRGTSLTPSS